MFIVTEYAALKWVGRVFLAAMLWLCFNTFAAKRDCSRIYQSLPNATIVKI